MKTLSIDDSTDSAKICSDGVFLIASFYYEPEEAAETGPFAQFPGSGEVVDIDEVRVITHGDKSSNILSFLSADIISEIEKSISDFINLRKKETRSERVIFTELG